MSMRIRFAALALPLAVAGFLSTTLSARPPVSPSAGRAAAASAKSHAPRPAPAAQAPRPALWKIADADTTIWLFGTIHALPADLPWLQGKVATALKGSQVLVTELPDTPPEAMQAAVMAHGMLPPDQTLRAIMSEADRAAYDKAMTGMGFRPETFDRAQPWLAAMSLVLVPVKQAGYDPASGADVKLAALAKARGIPREGLETAEGQMAMFAGLPQEVQYQYLREVVAGIGSIKGELAAMIKAWSAGQADKVAELDKDKQDDPRMIATLITDRNKAWADWVQQRMAKPGVVFMAVGAGHLAGKDSVQEVLRQRGIETVRVQ